MKNDIPTPRTDAADLYDYQTAVETCGGLERDLAAARAEAARLRDELNQIRMIACGITVSNCGIQADNIKSRISALSLPVATTAERVCRWVVDDDGVWATACGNAFLCDTGTPSENKFKCCPYCGGKIEEVRT